MFDDRALVDPTDKTVLTELVSSHAPRTSADAYRSLPAVLAQGDDTVAAIHARIDLALLSASEGLMESALYQIDELTKDARRVRDLVTVHASDPAEGDVIVQRADAARAAIEGAASRVTHPQ